MITYYKRTLKDKKIRELNEFEVGCWINAVNPTEEEINFLSEKFELDKQNLISGLDENEVPRVEFEDSNVYLIIKQISKEEQMLGSCLILISHNFILTLSKTELDFIKKIFEKKKHLVTTQKLKTLITFLSIIGDEFEKETIKVVKIVNAKKASTKEIREKDLEELLHQEEKLNSFISAYSYTMLTYDRLIKKVDFYEEDKEIMEDLIIEFEQALNLCKSSLKTISNLRSYHSIILSNKTSRIITILTIFTIFFSISTTISGFYGMNVALPFQDEPNIFIYIVMATLIIGLSLLVYFVKTKL